MIPGLGRSPGGGHGNPLQYSCLEEDGFRLNINNECLLGLLIIIGISKYGNMPTIYQYINSTHFMECAIILGAMKTEESKSWVLSLRYIQFCHKRKVKEKHFLCSPNARQRCCTLLVFREGVTYLLGLEDLKDVNRN